MDGVSVVLDTCGVVVIAAVDIVAIDIVAVVVFDVAGV
jgi:hypothetical protein